MDSKHQIIEEAIRVNHAGEYAAKIIYHNQIRLAKTDDLKQTLSHMLHQEEKHLEFFNEEIKKRHIRPTIFLPLWNILSKLLGSFSAKEKYIMMVTQVVEEVIEEHYKGQIDMLEKFRELELVSKIKKFMQEEVEHKDLASTKTHSLSWTDYFLSRIIAKGCRTAIFLSKKI